MIDMYESQMIHRTYYRFVGGVPPSLFFLLFNLAFVVDFQEDQDPYFFFHASKHPIPLK